MALADHRAGQRQGLHPSVQPGLHRDLHPIRTNVAPIGWLGASLLQRWRRPALLTPIVPRFALTRRLDAEADRWFLWLPALLSVGIALYYALPGEPSMASALSPVMGAFALRLVVRRGTLPLLLSAALLAVTLGFALAKLRTEMVRTPSLASSHGPVTVTGWIERIEARQPRGLRLTVRVIAVDGLDADIQPQRVRLYSRFEGTIAALGDAVELRAVLKPLPDPVIPGGYDFARQAWFQRIGATGFLISRPTPLAEPPEMPIGLQIATIAESIRQNVSARVRAGLPGPMGGVADALITGERGGIPQPILDALRASGLAHILAISGLHMVMMAGAIFWLLRAALALSPVLALSYPIKKWAAGFALLGAAGYLVLSGASIATQRAFIMLSLMFVAVLLDRPAISMRNLALAALGILAIAPESLLDVGFQMSFAAVTGLVAVYEAIAERNARRLRAGHVPRHLGRVPAYFAGILLTTAIASIAVAPLSAFHFHELARYSLLANLLAIPVFSLLVMPMALATMLAMPLGLEAWPLWLMGEGLLVVTGIARETEAIAGSVARIGAMPLSALQLITVGGLWLACWRGRWRLLGLMGVAGGILLAPTLPKPDILIAGDGSPVMVRDRSGVLQAMPGRGGKFELSVWLESDGDARGSAVAPGEDAFWCDQSGCTARLHAHFRAGAADSRTEGPAVTLVDTARTISRDADKAWRVLRSRLSGAFGEGAGASEGAGEGPAAPASPVKAVDPAPASLAAETGTADTAAANTAAADTTAADTTAADTEAADIDAADTAAADTEAADTGTAAPASRIDQVTPAKPAVAKAAAAREFKAAGPQSEMAADDTLADDMAADDTASPTATRSLAFEGTAANSTPSDTDIDNAGTHIPGPPSSGTGRVRTDDDVLLVAIARDISASYDDCRRADIVIMIFDQAQPCPSARLVIDRRDLRAKGAHAIRRTATGFSVETVQGARGRRPWTLNEARPKPNHSRDVTPPEREIRSNPISRSSP